MGGNDFQLTGSPVRRDDFERRACCDCGNTVWVIRQRSQHTPRYDGSKKTHTESRQASFREGKVVYDLANNRFIRLFQRWGHPSWEPASEAIFEKGNFLSNVETGRSRRYAPSSPSNHPTLSPNGTVFVTDADVSRRDFGKPGDWAIVVGDTRADRFVVVAQFNNTGGAKSWRRSHPHPVFSADGRRIYYNVNENDRTRLFVAECGRTNTGPP
jgi:Tol biopolymer transport system component